MDTYMNIYRYTQTQIHAHAYTHTYTYAYTHFHAHQLCFLTKKIHIYDCLNQTKK